MKLRIFEKFVEQTDNIGYAKAKMQELEDLVKDTNENGSFDWYLENDRVDGYILNISLLSEKSLLNIEFDIDQNILGMYSNSNINFTGNVESIEDGLDRIEKSIYNHLGIQENKKFKSNIVDQIIDSLLDDEDSI